MMLGNRIILRRIMGRPMQLGLDVSSKSFALPLAIRKLFAVRSAAAS
jgi:hypothetical protein